MVALYFRRREFAGKLALWAGAGAGLLSLPLGGCALVQAPGGGLPPLPPPRGGHYRLGAGDGLRVLVYDQAQLSGTYEIDDSGMIDMPLLGLLPAAGKTTARIADEIGQALKQRGLILAPSVAVEVAKYRPFYALGEVSNPGQYPYRPGMTVLTAISIAGGFTYRAVEGYVGVTRDAGDAPRQYRAPITALVAPGDVITVFERRF